MVDSAHIRTKADERAVEEGCYWSEEHGQRAVRFIETYCRISSGFHAGKSVTLLPWQKDQVIRPIFSWLRPDGTRRFRTSYISCAKKNGKSFLTACIALYCLMADGEESPFVVSAACDRSQAGIIFDEMKYSIDHHDQLAKWKTKGILKVAPSRKTIQYTKNNGRYVSLSSDAPGKAGYSYSCVIVDEFAFHKSSELYSQLKFSGVSRKQPLLLVITTSGHDRTSVCYTELYQYSKKILDGVSTDTSFYPLIYEANESCSLDSQEEWHRANPSLGVTQTVEDFAKAAEAARHSTTAEMDMRWLRLNQWIQSTNVFLNLDNFDACKGSIPDLTGRPAFIGLDLAATTDLAGVTTVIPHDGKFYVLAHAFVPEAAVREREQRNLTRYTQFAQEGSLTITQGNACDYEKVREYILNLSKKYSIKEIVIDRYNAIETAQILEKEGFKVYAFPQTPGYFNDPTKQLEKLVLDRKIVHDGSNLLRWQAQNLVVDRTDKGLISPSKKKSADKVDNLVALIMAIGSATQHGSKYESRPSVYENRGLTLI